MLSQFRSKVFEPRLNLCEVAKEKPPKGMKLLMSHSFHMQNKKIDRKQNDCAAELCTYCLKKKR